MTKDRWTNGLHIMWYSKGKEYPLKEWIHPYLMLMFLAMLMFMAGVLFIRFTTPNSVVNLQCFSVWHSLNSTLTVMCSP